MAGETTAGDGAGEAEPRARLAEARIRRLRKGEATESEGEEAVASGEFWWLRWW